MYKIFKVIWFIIPVFLLFAFAVISTGCQSQPVIIDANEAIVGSLDSLRQIRYINERSRAILDESERFLADLTERLRSGAIEFRRALEEYDRFVLYLITRIEELEKLSRGLDEEVLSSLDSSYHSLKSMHYQFYGEDSLPDSHG